jgi:hypothetical protein
MDLLGSISDSRLIPSGVISKAHERIRAAGNPRTIAATNTFMGYGGASKVGTKLTPPE